ncbi:MAG: GntR family transcriptional regulator [Ilumatobacteraceae bacterium]
MTSTEPLGSSLTESLGSSNPLHRRLSDRLKARLMAQEWLSGDQMPTETQLSAAYSVSRSTVRTALKLLESEGLVEIRHGSGTFVTGLGPMIRAGLQELRSMTSTIAEQGHTPGMDYRSCRIRPATKDEVERLDLDRDAMVLAIERAVLSDGKVVAFSYDSLPFALLPDGFDPDTMEGSVFDRMDQMGLTATHAVAEVHAVVDTSIGWGRQRPSNGLYVLLEQVHYGRGMAPIAHSRTYFVEGRFQFMIVRTR